MKVIETLFKIPSTKERLEKVNYSSIQCELCGHNMVASVKILTICFLKFEGKCLAVDSDTCFNTI